MLKKKIGFKINNEHFINVFSNHWKLAIFKK